LSFSLYVGIDVSKRELLSQFMNRSGELVRSRLASANNLQGAGQVASAIRAVAAELGITQVLIGMEATNLYWYHLEHTLRDQLAGLEVEIFVLNPSVVSGFKRAYPTLPKTDAVDAWVIADRLRFGRVQPSPVPAIQYEVLKRLTRFRYQLAEALRREKQRALDLIFLKFTNYQDEVPFGVFTNASMALLEHFTPDEIAKTDLAELAQFLAEHGNNRLGGARSPAELAQELQRAARRAYRLHPQMEDAVDVTLAMTFESIRFKQRQLQQVSPVIKRELRTIPQTIDSIPGLGPVCTAGIIAETGDIRRYHSQAALAKTAGLTWHRHQSGGFEAEETSLTKAGNRYLRYYLVEAANRVRVQAPEYRRYYHKKYHEVSKHQHKRALVLTARKLVRLIFALLSRGQIYRPQGGR
jgi:transposase